MSGGGAAVSSLESPTAKGASAAGSGVSPGQAAFPPRCKSQVEEMRACGKKGEAKGGHAPRRESEGALGPYFEGFTGWGFRGDLNRIFIRSQACPFRV